MRGIQILVEFNPKPMLLALHHPTKFGASLQRPIFQGFRSTYREQRWLGKDFYIFIFLKVCL